MGELRDVLERRMDEVDLQPLAIDRIYANRDRRRRNARLRAGIVAAALSVIAAVALVRAFPDPEQPVDAPTATSGPRAFLIDVANSERRDLPGGLGSLGARYFAVSPTDDRIVYTQLGVVTVANLDGSGARALTPGGLPSWTPAWSPDGDRIVFAANPRSDRFAPQVFVVDLATGDLTQLTSRGEWRYPHPSFGADGKTVLLTGYDRVGRSLALWTVPADGSDEPRVLLPNAAFGSYSPDGTLIAFHRAGGNRLGSFADPQISLATARGDERRSIGLEGGSGPLISWISKESLAPAWSPDGSRIALEDAGFTQGIHGPRKILVMDVATGRATVVGSGRRPVWFDADTLIVQTHA